MTASPVHIRAMTILGDLGRGEGMANIDACTREELTEMVSACNLLTQTFGLLVDYAHSKAKATDHRLAGNVQEACELDKYCDDIFRRLPRELRW